MNRQPFQTPPRWWSPCLSPFWVKLWRPMRRQRGYRHHGLLDVEVRGLEHLREALEGNQGVLITPNHPTHADPFVLLEAADRLGRQFYFMTAWQVFAMTHRLGRRILRQHGCFSINREGRDLRALRQAVDILQHSSHPLVIFPEGEVFHLNDRVTPFRKGAATAAYIAAQRGARPVACVPCGVKFQYVSDPTPQLTKLMNRLERFFSWTSRGDAPLARRIHRFADRMLGLKETEHLGGPQPGRLDGRVGHLMTHIVERLEDRYQVSTPRGTPPERVKHVRERVIRLLESGTVNREEQRQCRRDLDDLLCAMQLFSYQVDYVTEHPSIERLAETLDKLEEDVLGVRTANRRGLRRAIVSFGEPVVIGACENRKQAAADLTRELEGRVQSLLDEINGARPGRCRQPVEPLVFDVPSAPWALGPASA